MSLVKNYRDADIPFDSKIFFNNLEKNNIFEVPMRVVRLISYLISPLSILAALWSDIDYMKQKQTFTVDF